MLRQDVIPYFSNLPIWQVTDRDTCPLNLPLHFEQDPTHHSWKALYRSYAQMVKAWHSPADELILLTGLPSSGKSAILQHLQSRMYPVHPEDFVAETGWEIIGGFAGYRPFRHNAQETIRQV